MRIATTLLHFHRHGGIERAAFALTSELLNAGHEIVVYASTFEGLSHLRLSYTHVPALPWKTSAALLTFRYASRRMLRTADADLIHAQGIEAGMRDVVTAHSCHRAGMEVRKKIGRTIVSPNLHIADTLRLMSERDAFRRGHYKKIIAVSHGLKREIMEYYGTPEEDIVVIPNGYDPGEFFPVSPGEKIALRKKLGYDGDAFLLLFVGNEFERKGLALVIEALSSTGKSDIQLLVAGRDNPAPYMAYAQKLGVGPRIRFVGLQTELPVLYQASDCFIMPTFHEAFPIVGIEAAACGLPLLVTKVSGVEEYLRDGVNGSFIDRSVDDITPKILALYARRPLQSRLAGQIREEMKEYLWSAIASKVTDVYREVLAAL